MALQPVRALPPRRTGVTPERMLRANSVLRNKVPRAPVIARYMKRPCGPPPATRVSRLQGPAGRHGVIEQQLGPVHRAPLVELQGRKPKLYPARLSLYPDTLCLASEASESCSHLAPTPPPSLGMLPWIWLCRAFSGARPSGFEPETFGSVEGRPSGLQSHSSSGIRCTAAHSEGTRADTRSHEGTRFVPTSFPPQFPPEA
jgi:hypothetical protein